MGYKNFYTPETFPDYSNELVHLTKNVGGYRGQGFTDNYIPPHNARDRLIQILNEQTLRASRTPQVQHIHPDPVSVCFSEWIPTSIQIHANRYSSYGLVFLKSYIFNNGGGPVWYINVNELNYLTRAPQQRERWQSDPDGERPFIPNEFVPFFVPLAPEGTDVYMGNDRHFNWSFEREWRIPNNFEFEIDQIHRLYVRKEEERQEFSQQFNIPLEDIQVLVPQSP